MTTDCAKITEVPRREDIACHQLFNVPFNLAFQTMCELMKNRPRTQKVPPAREMLHVQSQPLRAMPVPVSSDLKCRPMGYCPHRVAVKIKRHIRAGSLRGPLLSLHPHASSMTGSAVDIQSRHVGLKQGATAVFTIQLNDGSIVGPVLGGANLDPGVFSFQFGLK